MDRLSFVNDVCHVHANPCYSWKCTAWNQHGMPPTVTLNNGFTDTLIKSRFFSWRRHYTKNQLAPSPLPPPSAWITIDEWVPGVWPLKEARQQWIPMKNGSHHGIAYINQQEDVTAHWSTHAKRHLKTFIKSGCTVRDGSLEDITTDMLKSQVPKSMSLTLARLITYRLNKDPETINILVAENAEGKRIGCFVCANDAESKESMYLMGYFLPEAAKLQPMTGLVYTWLAHLQKIGWRSGNFGLMLGPHATKLDPWWGLSNFKTHFGITRVHLPQSYWKIRTSLTKK